jgi:hypothetical protein
VYFTSLEGNKVALQFENLLQVRPIQEILELAAHGEGACFLSTMPFVGLLGSLKIFGRQTHPGNRLNLWRKSEADIFFHLGLIAFSKPDVLTSGLHDLNRNRSLGV